MNQAPLEVLLSKLSQVKRTRTGWSACCPAHEDRRPSLSVALGDDGRVLLYCQAGCEFNEICAALGITPGSLFADGEVSLFPKPAKPRVKSQYRRHDKTKRAKNTFATAEEAIAALERQHGPKSSSWDYHAASGKRVGVVVRWDVGDGKKDVRPVSLYEDGWHIGGMPTPRPLYNLPALASAVPVYVVEGEKAADAANSLGLVATTSPHGAKSADKADWTPMAGKEVIIFPDNDPPGEKYAQDVAYILRALTPAPTVKIVTLPDLPEHGDIVDFIAAHRDVGRDSLRKQIEELAAQTSPENPAPTPPSDGPKVVPDRDHGRSASASAWPEPEPLPEVLPPVAPFDIQLLPAPFRAYVLDVAERMQCPIDFPAVAMMVVEATILGRRIGICPKQHDDWLVIPNVWGTVVGRPGLMKTPAIAEPLSFLKKLEVDAKHQFEEALREYAAQEFVQKAQRKVAELKVQQAVKKGQNPDDIIAGLRNNEPEVPIRRRYLCNDTSVEKLGEILNENPNGVLVFRDELIGLLRSLDRDGQEGARAFYLEAWNGNGRFTYDRIGRGTVDIEAAVVSVLGCIQPGPFSEYLRGATKLGRGDDGLVQRLQLTVWPDVKGPWRNVDTPPDHKAKAAAWSALRRLQEEDFRMFPSTDEGIPFLRFSETAQLLFNEWRKSLEERLLSGELHAAMESHLAKYRSLVPTLALLIEMAERPDAPSVSEESLKRAIGWAAYLESHANRLYAPAMQRDLVAAKALAAKIQAGKVKDGFTLRDVYRAGWTHLTERQDALQAIVVLIDAYWLQVEQVPTDGRTATVYHIHPKILAEAQTNADKADRSPHGGTSGSSVSAAPGDLPDFTDSEWGET